MKGVCFPLELVTRVGKDGLVECEMLELVAWVVDLLWLCSQEGGIERKTSAYWSSRR
jgi:hypothetical protein